MHGPLGGPDRGHLADQRAHCRREAAFGPRVGQHRPAHGQHPPMPHHAQGEDFPGPTPHAVQRQMRHAVAFRGYQGQCGGDQPRHQPGGREPRPGPGAGHALVALAGGDRYWARQRAHQGGRSQTLSHEQGGHQVRQRTQRGRMHRAGCRQCLYPGFDQRVQFQCRGHENPPGPESVTSSVSRFSCPLAYATHSCPLLWALPLEIPELTRSGPG